MQPSGSPSPCTPNEVNKAYIDSITSAPGVVFQRLTRYILPRHLGKIEELKLEGKSDAEFRALDFLGDILVDSYDDVRIDIETTMRSKGESNESKISQSIMQSVKSSAGKIFERYVGLAIAMALNNTGWAVWHNRRDVIKVFRFDPSENLRVITTFNGQEITVDIEGDILIGRIGEPESPLIVVSAKSTLKDRLHNAAFWGLIKKVATNDITSKEIGLKAENSSKLSKVIYILACADIAQQQADLVTSPRRKIQFDASMLDYAFAAVSTESAPHLPYIISSGGREGDLFHRLSVIGRLLEHLDRVMAEETTHPAKVVTTNLVPILPELT